MSYANDDVRRVLTSAPGGIDTAGRAPREPSVFTWDAGGQNNPPGAQSRYVRGQNFCIAYTVMSAGAELSETSVPDEHVIVLPTPSTGGERLTIETAFGTVMLDQPGFAIIPPGDSTLRTDGACKLLRIFTCRATGILDRAENGTAYATADPAVTPIPPLPGRSHRRPVPRVLRLAHIPQDPDRLGRIIRTDSLIVNWFPTQTGPRDPDRLSPHVHEDFEQASVTLFGDYVHHFRFPWTPRLSEWRPDQTVECTSPAVALIPPGVVHTTRAIGPGDHELVDVFAPPRPDFAAQGWVLNEDDYADTCAGDHTDGAP